MADAERIEHLEQIVRQLRAEVMALRSEVRRVSPQMTERDAAPRTDVLGSPPALAGAPATPPAPAAFRAVPPTARSTGSGSRRVSRRSPAAARLDLEALVGRYGTIALATLTIVVGAGAFLTWAIANGMLGPLTRLGIGAVVAMVIAALGIRLRARGAPRYGNALLGLALALAHVEAWGAGPSLHIVSSGVALAIAATASVALATLALRIAEESLFAVGLGGALLAPFVVSEGDGHLFVLLGYGLVVLGIGIYAVRGRQWAIASWLMVVACLVYAATGADVAATSVGWSHAFAPAFFALCCAWSAVAWGGERQRRTFALGYLGITLVVLLAGIGTAAVPLPIAVGLPLAVTVTASLVARLTRLAVPARVVSAVILPLGAFGAAVLVAIRDAGTPRGAVLAALWTALAALAAWDANEETRPLHAMVAGLVSAVGVMLALHGRPLLMIVALAAHAVLFAALLRRMRHGAVLAPIAVALATAIGVSFVHLASRVAFQYVPFLTAPSAAALSMSLGCWLVWSRFRGVALGGDAAPPVRVDVLAGVLAALVTFFWGREELRRAFSPDVAIFLLVLYFAIAGVVAIWVGRRRTLPIARFAGLALALYAALKAVFRAWDYGAVGLKVGSCALAGAFLFAVAYWYRAAGRETVSQ